MMQHQTKIMTSKLSFTTLVIGICILVFLYYDFHLYKTIQNENHQNIKITVKAVMLDHVNSYILQPLSEQLVAITSFPQALPWLTANHISFLGVLAAMAAAYLVNNDQLYMRRIGVLMFVLRQFLDDLDGLVARFHMGIDTKKQVSLPNSSGYLVDGVCDAIGVIIFWWAVTHWNCSNKQTNVLQSSTTYKLLGSKLSKGTFKHYFLLLAMIGLSSLFWNIFLIQYHQTLDPSVVAGFERRTELQEEIFKSALMFVVMWAWRILNPHALTNYLLLAVWLNQPTQYAKRTNNYLFWSILGVSFLCLVHLKDVKYRLNIESFVPIP